MPKAIITPVYSAYVQDKSRLDLQDIPVEHYNLKLREHREGRDR